MNASYMVMMESSKVRNMFFPEWQSFYRFDKYRGHFGKISLKACLFIGNIFTNW